MYPEIRFYETNKNYDIFSNLTQVPFFMFMNGHGFLTQSSEQFFQAVRLLLANKIEEAIALINSTQRPGAWIQQATNAIRNDTNRSHYDVLYRETDSISFQYNCPGFNEGDKELSKQATIKEQLMFQILACKFTQNYPLLKALLDTGNSRIVEDTSGATYNDAFWGNGWHNDGFNALGRILMRLRQDFSKELASKGYISVRTGLSPELSTTLGFSFQSNLFYNNVQLNGEILLQTLGPTTVNAYHQMIEAKQCKQIQQDLYHQAAAQKNITSFPAPLMPITTPQSQVIKPIISPLPSLNVPFTLYAPSNEAKIGAELMESYQIILKILQQQGFNIKQVKIGEAKNDATKLVFKFEFYDPQQTAFFANILGAPRRGLRIDNLWFIMREELVSDLCAKVSLDSKLLKKMIEDYKKLHVTPSLSVSKSCRIL